MVLPACGVSLLLARETRDERGKNRAFRGRMPGYPVHRYSGPQLDQYQFEVGSAQTQNGAETWAYAEANRGGPYSFHFVKKLSMNQHVAADASRVVQGITDSGKADINPESEAALKESVQWLQTQHGLKLSVVGRTDYVGAFHICSRSLVGKGTASAQPRPFGAGPVTPVASHETEDARAKSRRVEPGWQ